MNSNNPHIFGGLAAIICRDWSLACDLCGHDIERHCDRAITWEQAAIEAAQTACASCGRGRYFVQGVLFVDHAR